MATTERPDLAIIIPHYNDVARLVICLRALTDQDTTGTEIVVVDNASPDAPDRIAADFPQVRFLTQPERGAGPARNMGVAQTQADTLAFIDADCIAAPDWIAAIRQVRADGDVVGGRVDVHDETPPPRNGAEAFENVFAFNFRHYIENQRQSGAGNLVTTRAVFEDVGPFRVTVSEDTDWTRRAVAQGYSLVYRDGLIVSHPSRQDWAQLKRKWLRLTQEMFALELQGADTAATRLRWGLRALAMPLSALVHLPKILRSPALNGGGERARGAATLFRIRLQRMAWMLQQALGRPV
ncbi:MAG: glycosyltransferase family A protein [Pseudomonadota bacterium]